LLRFNSDKFVLNGYCLSRIRQAHISWQSIERRLGCVLVDEPVGYALGVEMLHNEVSGIS
jgi:hypothetical protein